MVDIIKSDKIKSDYVFITTVVGIDGRTPTKDISLSTKEIVYDNIRREIDYNIKDDSYDMTVIVDMEDDETDLLEPEAQYAFRFTVSINSGIIDHDLRENIKSMIIQTLSMNGFNTAGVYQIIKD